ncbi:MAG: tetratricopeptide repeat protein [Hyphomonadaceae bacterium]|nr:tetratricopeptide repeat protein [Hyphomonadaceae bacterium]
MRIWIGLVLAGAVALAACEQRADPLAEARAMCADERAESEARMNACTTLIDSGAIEPADRAEALAHRGDATHEAGDVTGALRDYNAALDASADQMRAMAGRAEILIESGQLDAAEPLVARLIEAGEFTARAHFYAGEIARLRSDFPAATAAYDRAIAADNHHYMAFTERGRIKQAHEDYDGAIEDYGRAIAINPQYAPALAGRCWSRVLKDDGGVDQARTDADAAAEFAPRLVQGQLCRGLLQLRAGEWDAARASYEKALEVEPGNPNALFGRGVARRRGGDRQGTQDMNQARDFEPNIGRAFEELGVQTY